MTMKNVIETCFPRDEVLSGELRDEMFAAKLLSVIDGTADPIYQDPRKFFENTFPTEGLKTLIREVTGRLSGKKPANSPFIRLETSFGGGKTHNLIALYHIAVGQANQLKLPYMESSWLPAAPWRVAGIVGSDMAGSAGIKHETITTRTIWGEIAYRLGGESGFLLLRDSDEAMSPPSQQQLEALIGDRPTLIMLDEMALYLRKAKAISTPNRKSDLAEQTVAFLMDFIEFATTRQNVCLVLTLADSKDAFGKENDTLQDELEELKEAQNISARQERVITPTAETEISRIVAHRLFESIDQQAAEETAAAFSAYLMDLSNRDTDLPGKASSENYRREILDSYPFHPELLLTLDKKTSTIPNFQKTRGALRLLAQVVRQVWQGQASDCYLITPGHVDLGNSDIVNELTSRLDRPRFRSVVEADIISSMQGSVAHCQVIDTRWTASNKPNYAYRTGATIFLHSLTQGTATGLELSELLLSILQPGDEPHLVRKALSIMLAEEKSEPGTACWFLHFDGHRYRFKTEPSLEKIIQDEIYWVGRTKPKDRIEDRIRQIWRSGFFKPIFFPAEAAQLDDDSGSPKLAILHFDACVTTAGAAEAPDLVAKLYREAGSQGGNRRFKNNVLFLVADQDAVERMTEVSRRYEAIKRILCDTDRLGEFNEEQRKSLKNLCESAELDVRVSITRAYRFLFYPSTDYPKGWDGIVCEALPAQDSANVETDQSKVVFKFLKNLGKLLTGDDETLSAAFVRAKAWPANQMDISTEELRVEFAKRIGLRMLLDINQLKKTIKNGISQGQWYYYNPDEQLAYGPDSPPPAVSIDDKARLYLPDEVRRLKLPIKGEELPPEQPCPLCGRPGKECTCSGLGGEDGSGEFPSKLRTTVSGAPGQVFQRIIDEFHDKQRPALSRLIVSIEGQTSQAVQDLKALGLAIPQLGKARYHLSLSLGAEYGEGTEKEDFNFHFSGFWKRYQRVKSLTDSFASEARRVNLQAKLTITWDDPVPVGGEQFLGIKDVLTTLGMGNIHVIAEE
jgi:hypothetical protein